MKATGMIVTLQPAIEEGDDDYLYKPIAVRLPSDNLDEDKLRELSGPITTYNINGGQSNACKN